MADQVLEQHKFFENLAARFDAILVELDNHFCGTWPVDYMKEEFVDLIESLEEKRDDLLIKISLTHDIQDPK